MRKSRLIIYSLVIGLLIASLELIYRAAYYDCMFYSSQNIDKWIGILFLILMIGLGLGYPLLFLWKSSQNTFSKLFKMNLGVWFVYEIIIMFLGDYFNPMFQGHEALWGLFSVKHFLVSFLFLSVFYLVYVIISSAMIGVYFAVLRIKYLKQYYQWILLGIYLSVMTIVSYGVINDYPF